MDEARVPLSAVPIQFPDAVADLERDFLALRRAQVPPDAGTGDPGVPLGAPLLGLALSGGGIRSATFSLGVIQGLARLRLLSRVDYLSTVSGGGYIGAFLGGLFCPRGAAPAPVDARHVEEGLRPGSSLQHPMQPSLRWLRENGRYLTPGGSGDVFLASATVLRNWATVLAVVGLAIFTLSLLADLATGWLRVLASLHVYDVGPFGKVLLSYWFVVGLFLVGTLGVVSGWAYWLVGTPASAGPPASISRPYLWVGGLSVAALATSWAVLRLLPRAWGLLLSAFLFGVYGFVTLATWGIWAGRAHHTEGHRRLSRLLRGTLVAVTAIFGFGVLDSLTWTVFAGGNGFDLAHSWFPPARWMQAGWLGLAGALFGKEGLTLTALSVLAVYRERLEKAMGEAQGGKLFWTTLRWALRILLAAAALAVALAILVGIGSLAHSATTAGADFRGMEAVPWAPLPGLDLGKTLVWLALSLAACLTVARTTDLLNLTTLESFYTAALTRAYLGASNEARKQGDNAPDRRPEDDIPLAEYRPWERGGPLHIVNTTLNVTTGGTSQVMQRDRKGTMLAVGPAGLSVHVRHHALWSGPEAIRGLPPGDEVFDSAERRAEKLTLGQWVGISGAALSTGMGSRTSLALSLLCGFLNLRLGHWWWSGQARPWKGTGAFRRAVEDLLPVQAHLGEEWLARFPGAFSRYWYLTDGGHFENSAVYELIRRRLPLVILSDNGQDPTSRLGDLANLVAKARVDFGTEIYFLGDGALDKLLGTRGRQREAFGTLDELMHHEHKACAALAELHYSGLPAPGYLLLLKPTVVPNLPMDLRDYAASHKEFPQQSTGDQFFDERQWESYRKLGEFITVQALGDEHGRAIPWLQARLLAP